MSNECRQAAVPFLGNADPIALEALGLRKAVLNFCLEMNQPQAVTRLSIESDSVDWDTIILKLAPVDFLATLGLLVKLKPVIAPNAALELWEMSKATDRSTQASIIPEFCRALSSSQQALEHVIFSRKHVDLALEAFKQNLFPLSEMLNICVEAQEYPPELPQIIFRCSGGNLLVLRMLTTSPTNKGFELAAKCVELGSSGWQALQTLPRPCPRLLDVLLEHADSNLDARAILFALPGVPIPMPTDSKRAALVEYWAKSCTDVSLLTRFFLVDECAPLVVHALARHDIVLSTKQEQVSLANQCLSLVEKNVHSESALTVW